MKHIKQYEELNNDPKKGDYILPKVKWNVESAWSYFFNNTIGKINYIKTKDKDKKVYEIIIYYNAEDTLEDMKYIKLHPVNKDETIFYYIVPIKKSDFDYSKNKEELEVKLSANKYNL